MDKIRKALDLARLERAPSNDARDAGREPGRTSAARPGLPVGPIVYTQTRVFQPSHGLLEANRILNPASGEAAAAAFRMLRTQVVQRMDANGWTTLAVFSPGAGDGKTMTAINLAINLANDQHHSVLLVEFDFRQPSMAAAMGFSPEAGVDDVLEGRAKIEEVLYHPDGFDRLVLLPARSAMANSSEVLAGPRCRELVAELQRRYPERIVIFDLPPVLRADDALAFAPLVECGLVVASEGWTRRADLVRTVELLHRIPLVGTVLNRAADVPGVR